MVIKLYISGISGNKEVKKKQQRVQMILDSKQISYEAIDITEPGKEKDKEFMQQNGKVRESLGKYPLPPQIFNDDDFCGDYEDFDMANEVDELEKFLHIETSSKENDTDTKQDEDSRSFGGSNDSNHSSLTYNPYEYHTFKIRFDGVNGVKEEVISNDLPKEFDQNEEMTESEVNGESEAVPALGPSENVTENVETPDEVAQEKEEGSTQENKTIDESGEKETEENVEKVEGSQESVEKVEERQEDVEKVEEEPENVEESEKHEDEGKEEEREEEKEEEENPKDEAVENPREEKSPPLEEEKEEAESDDEGKQSENEENESHDESPQPEKSQEE